MTGLSDLSTELLEHVILYLHPTQIAQCRSVSSRLKRLVDSSIRLSYSLELWVSGMVDLTADHACSTVQRLNLLSQSQRLFQTPHPVTFTPHLSFRLKCSETYSLGHSEFFLFRGCTFGGEDGSNSDTEPTHCGLMDLYSESPSETEVRWKCKDLGQAIGYDCFDVDVTHRLLAIRITTHPDRLQISLLDVFTGEPHPDAMMKRICMQGPSSLNDSVTLHPGSLDILDDLLVVSYALVYDPTDLTMPESTVPETDNLYVCIFDWRTGEQIEMFTFSLDESAVLSPISKDHFLTVRRCIGPERNAAIDLYTINRNSTTKNVQRTKRFLLPAFNPSWPHLDDCTIDFQVSQTPQLRPQQAIRTFPFVPRTLTNIVCLVFTYWDPDSDDDASMGQDAVNLFTPASTFFHYLDREGNDVDWAEWGPPNCRFFTGAEALDNRNDACGSRILSRTGQTILDFNVKSIRRELATRGMSSVSNIVTEPTSVDAEGMFTEHVAGSLPYRKVKVEGLKQNSVFWQTDRAIHVKQDEEGDYVVVTMFAPKETMTVPIPSSS